MKKTAILTLLILVTLALAPVLITQAAPAGMVLAQEETPLSDQELVEMYAPALYFHPGELFRPQSVDVMVNTARLRQAQRNWLDVNILQEVTLGDLLGFGDESYALDVWFGDEGASDFKNYSAHRAYYEAVLSPEAGGPPIITYAHLVRDEDVEHITIQYWMFYYYNDWFNKHEGDWEMVQVTLSAAGEPEWVIYSQHHGGTRRAWEMAPIEDGTHPAVYVALGSHANYFVGEENYPNGQDIGNIRIEIMDRTGAFGRIYPEVILTPTREEVEADPEAWEGFEWLPFGGHWGEFAFQSDFGGPLGPADKGDQWEQPYAWGMAQPLDTDTWYANRLRVAVLGEAAQGAEVTLEAANGEALPTKVELGGLALLHDDPPPGAAIIAVVAVPSGVSYDLQATWPDAEAGEVTHYIFKNIPGTESGEAKLTIQAGAAPILSIGKLELKPTTTKTVAATWDAADLVWLAGLLPASEVTRGVAISLLAGLLPTLLYVGLLYWADRYEKEPKRLLAAAFFWGAIPALVVAALVRIFFNLPADMLGPEAIEAVRAGLVTPLIEEAIKGLAVLYIARRYHKEFDNVLDGIIYGAMVGFGFAMTANTISYLGAFLLRGFAGLGSTIFIEGLLYGLNHGLYTAIFGAALGYARLTTDERKRWTIGLGGFALAVLGNALHNLTIRSALGFNLWSVAATWAGALVIVVVMGWSLERQRRVLAAQLAGEIPQALHQAMIRPGGRSRARLQALRSDGIGGWRKTRRIQQLSAELAFKKMQHARRPDEAGLEEEAQEVRERLREIVRE